MLLSFFDNLSNPEWYSGFAAVLAVLLLLGIVLYLVVGRHESFKVAVETLRCKLRRFFRRGSWFFLLVAIDVIYPWVYDGLIYLQVRGLTGADRDNAIAATAAKMVDPVQFYSKSWIAFSTFCQINALGWAALLVVPVLIDWAIGFYKDEQGEYPSIRGFKGTFLLKLDDKWRIIIFVTVWALELLIAAHSVDSAFRMQ